MNGRTKLLLARWWLSSVLAVLTTSNCCVKAYGTRQFDAVVVEAAADPPSSINYPAQQSPSSPPVQQSPSSPQQSPSITGTDCLYQIYYTQAGQSAETNRNQQQASKDSYYNNRVQQASTGDSYYNNNGRYQQQQTASDYYYNNGQYQQTGDSNYYYNRQNQLDDYYNYNQRAPSSSSSSYSSYHRNGLDSGRQSSSTGYGSVQSPSSNYYSSYFRQADNQQYVPSLTYESFMVHKGDRVIMGYRQAT